MSASSNRPADPETDHELNQVEQICHRFLESWRQGSPTPIERLLPEVSGPNRPRLLRGLLIIELRRRRNEGGDPQVAEYIKRFPSERALIEQVFEMVPPARRETKRPAPEAPPVRAPQAAEQRRRSTGSSGLSRQPAPPSSQDSGMRKPTAPAPERKAAKSARPQKGDGSGRPRSQPIEEPDEYAALLDPVDSQPRLPPPVLRKKKKKEPADKPAKKKRRSSESVPFFEFQGPLVLALVSLVIDLVVAFTIVPGEIPVAWYVAYKLGFIVVSLVVTTLALFAAAALLDTSYGFLNTALIKIAAIVLTQAWVGDLLDLIPIPFVGGIVAWLATFYMFVTFFDIDHLEAIRSMIIVRVGHTLAFWLLFGAFLSWAFTRDGGDAGGGDGLAGLNAADLLDDGDDDEDPGGLKPIAENDPAIARLRTLTQQFGDALVAQDYAKAYQFMESGYQATKSADDFAAIHRQAVAAHGKPLRCEAGVGTLDPAALRGPGFERFGNVPAETRRAWMHAELALDDGQAVHCVDCLLLMVESGEGLRIGAFEYADCD